MLGKTRLLGIVVEFPETLPEDLTRDSGPYLQLVGAFFAGGLAASPTGEAMAVYGEGFCGDFKCSAKTLILDGRVAAEGIRSRPDGTFETEFLVKEPPGFYRLRVTQSTADRKQLDAVAQVLVPITEPEQRYR